MNLNQAYEGLKADKPKALKELQGDRRAFFARKFPPLMNVGDREGSLVFIISRRSYLGAFFMAGFFGLTLIPFVESISMFVENGFSHWEDALFVLIVLVCLAYLSLYSYGFCRLFCRMSSERICFIFFDDKIVWAKKWIGYFQTKTFMYDDLAEVAHVPKYLANGMAAGWRLRLDRKSVLSCSEWEGACRWLYLLIKACASDREISFFDEGRA